MIIDGKRIYTAPNVYVTIGKLEYRFLKYLILRFNRPVHRLDLYEYVYANTDPDDWPEVNVIEVRKLRIKQKLVPTPLEIVRHQMHHYALTWRLSPGEEPPTHTGVRQIRYG